MKVVDETEQLAWVLLQTVNRMQAKASMVRLVVPRDPEVAYELGLDPDDEELLLAEEYLLDHGYIALADITLTRGAYTITPAGLDWLDRGLPETPEAPQQPEEEPEGKELRPVIGDQGERTLRRWWRRLFGS
jgi:hypothetical protein